MECAHRHFLKTDSEIASVKTNSHLKLLFNVTRNTIVSNKEFNTFALDLLFTCSANLLFLETGLQSSHWCRSKGYVDKSLERPYVLDLSCNMV